MTTQTFIPAVTAQQAQLRLIESIQLNEMILKEAQTIVTDEDSARQALSMALQVRKIDKVLDSTRKDTMAPAVDFQKAVNETYTDVQAKLDEMENSLQTKLTAWMKKQNENPFTLTSEIRVPDGIMFKTSKWEYEILDEVSMPKEYKKTVVDEDQLKADIKAGVRHIQGVRIFETQSTQMRIKN